MRRGAAGALRSWEGWNRNQDRAGATAPMDPVRRPMDGGGGASHTDNLGRTRARTPRGPDRTAPQWWICILSPREEEEEEVPRRFFSRTHTPTTTRAGNPRLGPSHPMDQRCSSITSAPSKPRGRSIHHFPTRAKEESHEEGGSRPSRAAWASAIRS